MIIVFFGAGGGIFIVAFMLMIIGGAANEICQNINQFITQNYIWIIALAVALSLAGAIIGGKLSPKKTFYGGYFLLILQLLFNLLSGIYSISLNIYDSGFLVIWSFIVYLILYIVFAAVSYLIVLFSAGYKTSIPLYLGGIIGMILSFTFW